MPEDNHPIVSTRERLLDAALRLFGEHGYAAVTVGAIEQAAGLQPRRGALYNHFPSKEALLAALVERQVEAAERGVREAEGLLPLGDLRADLLLAGRLTLRHLDAQTGLLRLISREAGTHPELIAQARERIAGLGHRNAGSLLDAALGRRLAGRDVAAIGSVALNALVGFWVERVLLGTAPSGMEEERYLAAWVEMMTATVTVAEAAAPR